MMPIASKSAENTAKNANTAKVNMSANAQCPVCRGVDINAGPRAGLVKCSRCLSLLVTMADGRLRELLDWLRAGRRGAKCGRGRCSQGIATAQHGHKFHAAKTDT